MEKNMRSRKGISMAEVVVALAVITIISIATLSVVIMSAKVEAKTVVTMEVRNSAENAVECFRFANGDAEAFVDCLNKTVPAQQGFRDRDSDGSYVFNAKGYTVTITPEQNGFAYRAVDNAGKEIYSFTFKNGGGQK